MCWRSYGQPERRSVVRRGRLTCRVAKPPPRIGCSGDRRPGDRRQCAAGTHRVRDAGRSKLDRTPCHHLLPSHRLPTQPSQPPNPGVADERTTTVDASTLQSRCRTPGSRTVLRQLGPIDALAASVGPRIPSGISLALLGHNDRSLAHRPVRSRLRSRTRGRVLSVGPRHRLRLTPARTPPASASIQPRATT